MMDSLASRRTRAVAMAVLALPAWLISSEARACTSFVQETPDGAVFGANLDLLVPADGLVVVNRRGIAKENFRKDIHGKTTRWVSKYGSITFNVAGRGFVWGGMNESGLVLSMLEDMASEFPEPDGRAPFDLGSWAQYVMDTCATVKDVIGVDAVIRPEADNDRPNHFLVADAKGGRAALEYIDGKLVVYSGRDLPHMAMTNMPYGRAQWAFERGGPRWWWSNPGRSAERFSTAAARASAYSPDREGNPIDYAFHTLSMVSDQYTQWSVGYHIAKRKIWFRTTRHPEPKWLSLDAFDFSCDAPSLMLDVLTDSTGNVEKAFAPYRRDVNLRVFGTMVARLGIQVSKTDAVSLMEAYEGFECAEETPSQPAVESGESK